MGTSNCFVVISHKAAKIADQGQIKLSKRWMNKQFLTNILAKTIYPCLACLARQRSNRHPSLTLGRCQDLQLSISHNHQNCWSCLSFAWDDYCCYSPDFFVFQTCPVCRLLVINCHFGKVCLPACITMFKIEITQQSHFEWKQGCSGSLLAIHSQHMPLLPSLRLSTHLPQDLLRTMNLGTQLLHPLPWPKMSILCQHCICERKMVNSLTVMDGMTIHFLMSFIGD